MRLVLAVVIELGGGVGSSASSSVVSKITLVLLVPYSTSPLAAVLDEDGVCRYDMKFE